MAVTTMQVIAPPTSGDALPAGSGVIKVYVRELDQLLDSMDPSPFHEKALDRNAEEYIVGSAKALPSRSPAALVVHLDQPVGLPDEAIVLGNAIRAHFARRAQLFRWQLHRLLWRGLISLVIGLAALSASLSFGQWIGRVLGGGPFATALGQSLHIGGWVAMAKPIEIFLYDWWEVYGDQRLYEELSRMPVQIVYTGQAGSTEGINTEPINTEPINTERINGDVKIVT